MILNEYIPDYCFGLDTFLVLAKGNITDCFIFPLKTTVIDAKYGEGVPRFTVYVTL